MDMLLGRSYSPLKEERAKSNQRFEDNMSHQCRQPWLSEQAIGYVKRAFLDFLFTE
jgi:hypothetical protein